MTRFLIPGLRRSLTAASAFLRMGHFWKLAWDLAVGKDRSMKRRRLLLLGFAAATLSIIPATGDDALVDPGVPLPDQGRILFLGDSITHAGGYMAYVETFVRLAEPGKDRVFINAGLPSETVSGLSEEGHADGKFPRPDLHERLDRVLKAVRPEVVFACYGMNDAIYQPLDVERFRAFREGILRLREKVKAAGAEIIHLTPAAYDAVPVGSDPANYDKVLRQYGEWLIEGRKEGWQVIDVHGAMNAALKEQRKGDGAFTFAKDGVHPDDAGHRVMARAVLAGLGLEAPPEIIRSSQEQALFDLVAERQLVRRDAWLSEAKHLRPGIQDGLPVAKAEAKAAGLGERIEKLLAEIAPRE